MKKMVVACIIGMLLIIGMGCVTLKSHNKDMAEQLVEELKEHDNDGNGSFVKLKEDGLFGYEVTFYSSWYDEEPDVYVIDTF